MATDTVTAGTLRFRAINKAQADFMACESQGALFSGAFGAGKTLALCSKGLKFSMDYPGNFGLICRKTRASMTHTTLKTFWDLVCPPELVANYNKTDGLVTLTNGSGIVFGGLDDYLKLGSLNLGWAGIDEAIESTEEDWDMLDGRLRLPNVPHQIFAATNPGPPAHYLYRRFFESSNANYQVFQASTLDNPELPQDYIDRMQQHTGVYYDRYVLGLWVGMEGLVYDSYNDLICRQPRRDIPKEWLIYSGHDFGSANPAAMFYAQDPATGYFWAWREYLPGAGRSVYDHVQEFKKITEGRTVIKSAGGNHTTEDEIRQAYTAHGWPIAEPLMSASVSAGIQRVYDLHAQNRIMVMNDLSDYLREKLSYAYKVQDGIRLDEIEHKNRYHLMDAERSILPDFRPVMVAERNITEVRRL